MNDRIFRRLCCGLCISLALSLPASAAGLLKSRQKPNLEMDLLSQKVDVVLNNGFARTEVTQGFQNRGEHPAEAIYSFPLPKQSSLSEVTLQVNGRELHGEVVEKQKAREIYENQKAQGNDTALAEKNDYKSYEVSVGNVRPGENVSIRLVYYQPLEIDLNVGRYVYPLAEGNTDDAKIPFWSVDDSLSGSFEFNLELKSAFPVKDVRMPGWETAANIQRVTSNGEETASGLEMIRASIQQNEGADLSRDLVFYYRLADDTPARVEMLTYRDNPKEDGTFMLVVTPAADLQPITRGSDWIFVLDVSGSMSGHKIATLADGVAKVIGDMRPEDRFRIVTFNNSARELTSGYVNATPASVQEWIRRVKTLNADGGTNLYAGLKTAYRSLDEDRTTGVVLVTDGVANVGNTAHKHFLELLKDQDLRLFTFVIGNSANQPLMERLAKASNGFAMNLSDADDIQGRLMQAKAKVLHEAMHDVRVKVRGEKIHNLTPAEPGSLYLGQQLVQFGRFRGEGPVDIEVSAKISGQPHSWTVQAELPAQDRLHPELERLWALSRIDEVMQEVREEGESDALRNRIVDLGTEYSLVTDYTSMLVVEDAVFENESIQRRNADRVARENQARQQRQTQAPTPRRLDTPQTFQGRSAPGLGSGSGPVGPLFLLVAAWMKRLGGKREES
jgi:Ca-activated chloride channel family protein